MARRTDRIGSDRMALLTVVVICNLHQRQLQLGRIEDGDLLITSDERLSIDAEEERCDDGGRRAMGDVDAVQCAWLR